VSKRLYRIRNGAMISGVCQGLAAFLNVDVAIIRVIFVVLTLVSGGMMALAYIAMTFIIPCANTGEERAAARGEPFNAQEVIDQAKKHYSEFKKEFKNNKEWRRHWREQRRAFKRRWREESYWWGNNVQRGAHNVAHSVGYAAQVMAGVMVPVLSVVSAALFCAWIIAMVLVATSNAFFGWPLPDTLPLWAALLILFFVYNMIAWTLRHARRAAYYASGGSSYAWYAAWDGMFSFVFIVVAFWLAYQHVPEVRDFVQHFPDSLNTLWNNITNSLQHHSTDKPVGVEHTALLL
ncbi:MAG TPA: PspC domain-containing protein, partial [Steroidobacteraceae bacterium]|nr:PspC domain-containing protein [Steroidobacteraceae bacterium]